MNFVDELKWRGMIHDIMPGTEELLAKGQTTAYVGIDPTADSLHVGHLVSVMMMKHFQMAGHKPIFIIGGATGMIGDPSGKSQERNLSAIDLLYTLPEFSMSFHQSQYQYFEHLVFYQLTRTKTFHPMPV